MVNAACWLKQPQLKLITLSALIIFSIMIAMTMAWAEYNDGEIHLCQGVSQPPYATNRVYHQPPGMYCQVDVWNAAMQHSQAWSGSAHCSMPSVHEPYFELGASC